MECPDEISKVPQEISEIEKRVVAYIPGRNGGTIGIVLPENDPDPHDLSELYRTLAEIAVNQAKRKAAQK